MLSASDNELICRVGPGTPMGELMRRYWLPALLSSELVTDGDPLRLLILGEKLVAFRDTEGRVGIIDQACPHRCASLFYGRNEEGGLRCVYHGWKFAVDGTCLDMANVPPAQDFKDRVKVKAYPAVERNGLVWTYMGPGTPPALPAIPYNMLPADRVNLYVAQRECNWLQGLEGDIDTSHVDFLHGGKRTVADYPPDDPRRFGAMHRAPEYEVAETDWGTMYGAKRPADEGRSYWRIGQFLLPFWTIAPSSPFSLGCGVRAWVPMDDTHSMLFTLRRKVEDVPQIGANAVGMLGNMQEFLPNSTDWYGRWRLPINVENDHLIDRQMQRKVSYTGIRGISQQDHAITESMGPIVDRTKEHLALSDRMIMVTRRRLIQAAVALRDRGEAPANALRPEMHGEVEGGYCLAGDKLALGEVFTEQFASFRASQPFAPAAE